MVTAGSRSDLLSQQGGGRGSCLIQKSLLQLTGTKTGGINKQHFATKALTSASLGPGTDEGWKLKEAGQG